MKEEFIKAIQECGIDISKLKFRYIEKGKYNEPEIWIYPKDNPKQQKVKLKGQRFVNVIYPDGSPVMESKSGLLLTKDTLADKEYLTEYLQCCL